MAMSGCDPLRSESSAFIILVLDVCGQIDNPREMSCLPRKCVAMYKTILGYRWGALLLLFVVSASIAAPIPWKAEKYSHFADQESLSDLLKTLVAQQDIPIVVSPKIKDVVSLHVQERTPEDIFNDMVKNYGLIWYYDKESLFVYKEDEVQTGSVSMKKMSPQEFTNALKRLQVLDDRFQWEISEVDNIIYFTGPERFISSVLEMAKVMDTQELSRRQIYRWKDKNGVVNFSSEDPVGGLGAAWDVKTDEKFPGFDVVDVVNHKKQAE